MEKNNALSPIICLLLLSFIVIQFGCGKKSDERLIIDTLNNMADKAEDKKIEEVFALISGQYTDHEGRSKTEMKEILEKYLNRYKGIVIYVLESKIPSLDPPHAKVHVDVALSHGAAKMMRKLVRVGTTFYRFHLDMAKEDLTWRVKEASWKRISADELYPESSSLINKIFPDVF